MTDITVLDTALQVPKYEGAPWVFVQGDYGGTIELDIYDADGDSLDITGGTPILRVTSPGGTVLTWAGTFTVTGTGECEYVVKSGVFNTAGNYLAELAVVYSDKTIRITGIPIKVEAALPTS